VAVSQIPPARPSIHSARNAGSTADTENHTESANTCTSTIRASCRRAVTSASVRLEHHVVGSIPHSVFNRKGFDHRVGDAVLRPGYRERRVVSAVVGAPGGRVTTRGAVGSLRGCPCVEGRRRVRRVVADGSRPPPAAAVLPRRRTVPGVRRPRRHPHPANPAARGSRPTGHLRRRRPRPRRAHHPDHDRDQQCAHRR